MGLFGPSKEEKQMQAEIQRLQAINYDLNQQLNSLTLSSQSQISSLQNQIANLNQENNNLLFEIETLKNEINKYLSNNNSALDSQDKQINLSYNKAKMLCYWEGRTINSTPNVYAISDYGTGLTNSAKDFLKNGLLRISTPRENVKRAGVVELKSCLRSIGEKVSGNKNELISRVLNASDEIIDQYFSDGCFYVLTDEGQKQIDNNSLFFANDENGYNFTVNELKKLKEDYPNYTDDIIFIFALSSKIAQSFTQKKWTNYGLLLRNLCNLLITCEKYHEALVYLWEWLVYNLSGVHGYYSGSETCITKLKFLTLDSKIVEYIDICISSLEININEFANFIKTNCFSKTPIFPFSYYSKENVLNIICDRLNGIEFSAETCKYPHNIPNPNSQEYQYFDELSINL